jgi:hypothetical protein
MNLRPQCNTELRAGDPAGLCPVCLLAGTVGAGFTFVHDAEAAERDNFGPYRLLTILGDGGMRTVYLASRPNRSVVEFYGFRAGHATRRQLCILISAVHVGHMSE